MPMLTTDIGRNATVAADKGGFQINLAGFAVSEAVDPQLSILDKALVGTAVYEGLIQSIEVVTNATVKLTLYIPPGYPSDPAKVWKLSEVGIYLQSGEMFAHGKFLQPFTKGSSEGLKLYVYVTANRLGEVVNVTFSTSFGLDSTVLRALMPPDKSGSNAIIVQDAGQFSSDLSTSVLATRFSGGGSKWAFSGHDLVFRGKATAVANPGQFTLDPGKQGGFWLNDDENVIIAVSAGPGNGEARRYKYSKSSNTFVAVDKPFSGLSTSSVLNIWRATKNQLPARPPGIPDYYCLSMGVNDYAATAASAQNVAFDYVPGQVSLVGSGIQQLNLPSQVPSTALGSKSQLMLWVAGKQVPNSEFAISGRSLVLNTPAPGGSEVQLLFFDKRNSSGSTISMFAAEYPSYTAGQTVFQLGTLPDNAGGVLVFVDGRLVSPNNWTYTGTGVNFVGTPPDGSPVTLISIVNHFETGASSSLIQSGLVLAKGQKTITVNADSFDRQNTVLAVDGEYVSKDQYLATSRQIILNKEYDKDVTVQLFVAASAAAAGLPTLNLSGNNTGPVWIDPAGSVGQPNTLTPVFAAASSSGSTEITVPAGIPNKNHLLVFVGGQFQDPSTYSFAANKVTLTTAPPAGMDIDVVGFASAASTGSKAQCSSFTMTSSADTTYNISSYTTAVPTLVFIGGVYQHRSQYTVSGGAITFNGIVPGQTIEIWVFNSVAEAGSTTMLAFGSQSIVKDRSTYTFDASLVNDQTANVQNTLAFASTVYQSKTAYSTSMANAGVETFTFPGGINKAVDKSLCVMMFLSGKTKTRLLTRDEFDSRNSGGIGLPNSGGWAILPSGMMIQHAVGNTVTGKADFIYFPVQFPNKCQIVVANEAHAVGWGPEPHWVTIHGSSDLQQNGYNHYCVGIYQGNLQYGYGVTYSYIAIGY